jgi:hypothetical protein
MNFRSWFLAGVVTCLTVHPLCDIRALQTASAGAVESPITMTLSTTSDHYKVDDPIPVVITLTNTGNAPIGLLVLFARDPNDAPYISLGLRFSLVMQGKEAEKTPFNRALRQEHIRGDPTITFDRIETATMKPGQVDRITIDVKKLFKISQPGSYVFSVVMPPNLSQKAGIHSPSLVLDVVPV